MIHAKKLLAAALACALAPAAHAAVELIAIGALDGNARDRSAATAAPLENGAPGNLLGGVGSGLAYAGCGRFLALPDRGPNALAYDLAVSDTTSYIDRFHTLTLALVPAPAGAALPFVLTPRLEATTLMHAGQPLVYGDGVAAGLPTGVPALNAIHHTHYFTGRADNFDPQQLSTSPRNARLDPESIRASNDGASVYVTDEYGPYVYRFNRKTGQRTGVFTLPDAFAATQLRANGDVEIAANTSGRVSNKGMEGLAIAPDGNTLYGVMQSPLLQDGGTSAPYTRIVALDLVTGLTRQFVYPLSNIGTASKPKYATVSDIVAINDHELLLDERDGKGLGDNSVAAFKRLYKVDVAGAADASFVYGATQLAPYALRKTLVLDVVAALAAKGVAAKDIPAKLEGLAFGTDVVVQGQPRHTLVLASDNDFIGTVVDSLHPAGIDNPNRFYVFAFGDADVPGFEPQQLAPKRCD